MQQFGSTPLDGQWQCHLFPERVGRHVQFHDLHVWSTFQTAVFSRTDKDIVLIFMVYLLQFAKHLQHDEIHPVLLLPEDSLSFYGYSHGVMFLFLMQIYEKLSKLYIFFIYLCVFSAY